MIFPIAFHHHYLQYLLKRDVTKLYIATAIRNLSLGMVSIFTPIYLYIYFNNSIPLTLLFIGVMFGLHGVLAVMGGKIMAKIGSSKSMLLSSFFYIGFFLALLLIYESFLFVPAAIIAGAVGMSLFWPAFHTDFVRFSSKERRGQEAGRINIAMLLPTILSPLVGGMILTAFGFPALFAVVTVVLFASAIPLFYSQERVEVYTDSYTNAWRRIFKKENRNTSIGLLTENLEISIHYYVWPLFLFLLTISFTQMGGITSFALIVSSLFMLYAGRISDTKERPWLLNIGAVWTSIAWILKYFITTPFSALLAQAIYQMSRAAARVPFWTFFYEKASSKEEEADEFIVYREILINVGHFFFFSILAAVFFLFPRLPIQTIFLIAAVLALGLMFLGSPPKIRLSKHNL